MLIFNNIKNYYEDQYMKKVLVILTILATTNFAYAYPPSPAEIIMVHDMQMINQQRFRMEELNDYNDVQTEKARYQKRTEPSSETLINKLFNKKKFVEENGQIKIENEQ